MAKKQQQPTVSAAKDDHLPLTPAAEVVQPPPSTSGTKRLPYNDTNQAKKKQKTTTTASAVKAKKLFERVFTKQDEVQILKGLDKFIAETGEYDTAKHLTVFLDQVKNSISFPVERGQLKDKVWRLKKKFETKAQSLKKGQSPIFSKSIDDKIFKLSKKIWGVKAGIVEAEETGKDNHFLSVNNMKNGQDLIGKSKSAEVEKRQKELQVAEWEVFAMRAQLVNDQITAVYEEMKSSLSRC